MNDIQIFDNPEFGNVRTMIIENEPWFVGKDIAEALGYKDAVSAIRAHVDEEDKGVAKCPTPSGAQMMTVINESGLYSLVLGSKLESAKKFKRWITYEVLPQIRKTGEYRVRQTSDFSNNPLKLLELHYESIKQVDTKFEVLADRVDKIELDMPLLTNEADLITSTVKNKVAEIMGGEKSAAYMNKRLRMTTSNFVYRSLKREFGVNSYKALRRGQLDKAIAFIDRYEPPVFLADQIRNENKQLRFILPAK